MTRLAEWRAAGRFVDLLGHRIFVRDSAFDQPPARAWPVLVLIHGFPTASWDWSPLWEPLGQRFRLVTMDLLGFGFSSKPRGHNYSIAEQADLVEGVLQGCGVESFHMLSHDYGDTVAQELLARDNARAQRRISSAILLNGGLFPETHRPVLIQRLLLTPAGPLLGLAFNRAKFERSMTEIFGPETPPSRDDLDAFWALIRENGGHRLMHRLIGYIPERQANRQRWVGALVDARCPLALINGSADPISGAHMVARWREVVGKGAIVELPGIGHYPQVEAPDAVARHVLDFLAGVAPA